MIKERLPKWWYQLATQHRQGVGRIFVLHDNVNDVVYYPSDDDLFRIRPHPFRDMLIYLLARQERVDKSDQLIQPFVPVFYCSPTIPLSLYHLKTDESTNSSILEYSYFQNHLVSCGD